MNPVDVRSLRELLAADYRLAAEYWHPKVAAGWGSAPLEAASRVGPFDGHDIECAFAELDDEESVRCWYYLLRAAELAS